MYTQRIQQMQNAMQRRPEVPGVSQARHQGQAMSSVPGAGVNALRQGLGQMSQARPAAPQAGQPSPFSPNWQPPGKAAPINDGSPANPPVNNRPGGGNYRPPPAQTQPAMGGIVPMQGAPQPQIPSGGFGDPSQQRAYETAMQAYQQQQAQQQPGQQQAFQQLHQAQQQPNAGIDALRSRLAGGGRRAGIRPSHW